MFLAFFFFFLLPQPRPIFYSVQIIFTIFSGREIRLAQKKKHFFFIKKYTESTQLILKLSISISLNEQPGRKQYVYNQLKSQVSAEQGDVPFLTHEYYHPFPHRVAFSIHSILWSFVAFILI